MAKPKEARYPGNNSIQDFKKFLRSKHDEIRNRMIRREVVNYEKASNYCRMLDDIIKMLNYRYSNDINVYTLLEYLKEDSLTIDQEISELEKAMDKAQEYIGFELKRELSEEDCIPDEIIELQQSRRKAISERRSKLYEIKSTIEECKREKHLVNCTKGIICRSNGFFSKL